MERSDLARSVVLCATLALAACAPTRATVPRAHEMGLARTYSFEALGTGPVAVAVVDQRGDRVNSQALVWTTQEVLSRALREAGVGVDGAAKLRVEVRILEYRADFELAEWKGCARLIALVGGPDHARIGGAKCVTRSMLGHAPADEALHDAYKDAVASLLAELDLLTAAGGSERASP